MGCVFSKPNEKHIHDSDNVKRTGLLDQHHQFINNNDHQSHQVNNNQGPTKDISIFIYHLHL